MADRGEWLRRLGAESLLAGSAATIGLDLRFDAAAEDEVRRVDPGGAGVLRVPVVRGRAGRGPAPQDHRPARRRAGPRRPADCAYVVAGTSRPHAEHAVAAIGIAVRQCGQSRLVIFSGITWLAAFTTQKSTNAISRNVVSAVRNLP